MNQIVLRHATISDSAALAELAQRTFVDAFAAQNRPEDLAAYLPTAYAEPLQRKEIEDPTMISLVAEQDGALIAYAQLREGPAEECVEGDEPIELYRFYVDQRFHGRGIAQMLMDTVIAAAAERGRKTLWLGVWELNPRAIAFYGKFGFTDVGSHIFMVGPDPQTDRIMVRRVKCEV